MSTNTTEQLETALAGRYAIERRIGEGGMATVYLARDLKHDRLTLPVGGGSQPRWSDNGKTLYYVGSGHLMAAQFSSGADLEVVRYDTLFAWSSQNLSGDAGGERVYDVMPNGREFVVMRPKVAESQNPLRTMMLFNWQSLLAPTASARTP